MSDLDCPELKPPTTEHLAASEDAASIMIRAADLVRDLFVDLGPIGCEWVSTAIDVGAYVRTSGLTSCVAATPLAATGDWIATFGPQLGGPLEAWLRAAARDAVAIGPDCHALAVARVILRGTDG